MSTVILQRVDVGRLSDDPMSKRLLEDNSTYQRCSLSTGSIFLCPLARLRQQSKQLPSITPLLKKPGLDVADPKSCRPIANLSVLSKLLERFVAVQLMDLNACRLLQLFQSTYGASHSTETMVTKVLADILMAFYRGDTGAVEHFGSV